MSANMCKVCDTPFNLQWVWEIGCMCGNCLNSSVKSGNVLYEKNKGYVMSKEVKG